MKSVLLAILCICVCIAYVQGQERNITKEIMDELEKFNTMGNEVGNLELQEKLKDLKIGLNDKLDEQSRLQILNRFRSYNAMRLRLEGDIKELITSLVMENQPNNKDKVKRLRDVLNKENSLKMYVLNEVQRNIRPPSKPINPTTTREPTTKEYDNIELTRRILCILRRYGIYGDSAEGIVDTLLNDDVQLKRLKAQLDKLDEDDDDYDEFWWILGFLF